MRHLVLLVAICLPACAVHAADAPATRPDDIATTQPDARGPILRTPLGDVEIFPRDNPWNTPVDKLPVHARSAAWIKSIGLDKPMHPDFGTQWQGAPNGIPFVAVAPDQKKVAVKFTYADESDPGPYPIPANPPIEGGPKSKGDRHILMIDPVNKRLYELFAAYRNNDGTWRAGSGAIFDLSSNKLRPAGWTSADAAGLPIFPGLVRYDEAVEAGAIRHALRFTVRRTQRGYIPPATHWASRSNDPNLPPMGMRVRLRADFDASNAPPQVRAIVAAMKTYGLLLADNGGDWFISGAPNPKWDDDQLRWLKRIRGRDLEVVDTGKVVTQ